MKTIFSFNWQKKARNNQRIFQKQIHFEHFPSLSFGPSQGHNSVNIGSNSTSRDSFVICRSRALIWHQDWWYFLMNCWRNQLLKFWPRLYLTYCIYRGGSSYIISCVSGSLTILQFWNARLQYCNIVRLP